MADKELVIKISEKAYNALTHTEFDANLIVDEMRKAIVNSTPLPKGHGDLVDRDAINERFDSIYDAAMNCSNQSSDKYLLDKLSMCLDTALPIIEADKAER